MSAQIENRLQSLILGIDSLTLLSSNDEDKNCKQFESLRDLIFNESSILSIFQHVLFKQNNDKKLNQKIYEMIMKKAEDNTVGIQMYQIMHELNDTQNFMNSLAVSQVVKYKKKVKELQKCMDKQQVSVSPSPHHENRSS